MYDRKSYIDGICSFERYISHSGYIALSLKDFQIDVYMYIIPTGYSGAMEMLKF